MKVHLLYDVETNVPAFYRVTKASVNDAKAMQDIPYEAGAYYIFDRGYNSFAQLFRINNLESFFVVRARSDLQYKVIRWKRRLPSNVLSDSVIQLTGDVSRSKYPANFRLVKYHDDEMNRDLTFLTNAFSPTSLEIANLYKNRWQVELFFKWLKQHLKIKKFWGTTENAVRIQIAAAITAYCLVAIIQQELKTSRSTYEMLQILSVSLMDKPPLKDLFEKSEPSNDYSNGTPFLQGFDF